MAPPLVVYGESSRKNDTEFGVCLKNLPSFRMPMWLPGGLHLRDYILPESRFDLGITPRYIDLLNISRRKN